MTETSSTLGGTQLEKDQVVPGVALRERDTGETVRLTDYRQRRALVLAFLHADCAQCEAYAGELAEVANGLTRSDGLVRVVLPPHGDVGVAGAVPVWVDASDQARQRLLGPDMAPPCVIVLDSFASAQEAHPAPDHDFPPAPALVETLEYLASLCG